MSATTYHYRCVSDYLVPDDRRELAALALTYAEQDLGFQVASFRVKWFDTDPEKRGTGTGAHGPPTYFVDDKYCNGFVYKSDPAVWIRASQLDVELIESIGHEARHQWQWTHLYDYDEGDATTYGRRFAQWFMENTRTGQQIATERNTR